MEKRPLKLHAALAVLAVIATAMVLAAPVFAQKINFDGSARGGSALKFKSILTGAAALPSVPGVSQQSSALKDVAPMAMGQGDRLFGNAGRWEGRKVKRLARRLNTAAATLYSNYRARSKTGNFFKKIRREAVKQELAKLTRATRTFNREIGRRWSGPHETRQNFREVLSAMDDVQGVMRWGYKTDRVKAEYREVKQLVNSLTRYFRHRGGRGGPGRGRDDWDRDRRDRGRDRHDRGRNDRGRRGRGGRGHR